MKLRTEVALCSAMGGGITAIFVKVVFSSNPFYGLILGMLISPFFWHPREVVSILKEELSRAVGHARANKWREEVKTGLAVIGTAILVSINFCIGAFLFSALLKGISFLSESDRHGLTLMCFILAVVGFFAAATIMESAEKLEASSSWRKVSRLLFTLDPKKKEFHGTDLKNNLDLVSLGGILLKINQTGESLHRYLKGKISTPIHIAIYSCSVVLWPIGLFVFLLIGLLSWVITLTAVFLVARRVALKVLVNLASHPRLSVMSGTLAGGATAIIMAGPVQAVVLWAMLIGGLTGLLACMLGEAATHYVEAG